MIEDHYSLPKISIDDCKHRGVYRICCRNLMFGVYDAENKSFMGIREKFQRYYLFAEYHYDTGTPFGTVSGMEFIEMLPDNIEIKESVQIPSEPGVWIPYKLLFNYLFELEMKEGRYMNSIFTIIPYKHGGQWVFDDAERELVKEPFVAGADDILDVVAQNMGDVDKVITLFAAMPFPGADFMFERTKKEMDGNWYKCDQLNMEGWLCPALFKYFETAPEYIYVKFKPIT